MSNYNFREISQECRIHKESDYCIIEWHGEISGDNIDSFSDVLMDAVAECKNIILEFSEVNFCISKAIGVMAVSIKKLKVKEGNLLFVNPTRRVLGVLKITKLVDMVKVFDSLDQAVADCK